MIQRRLAVMLICGAALTSTSWAEAKETWAEKLGYPKGKRVLLLHADDIGMCYEANAAARRYLTKGHVLSVSAMVPCPWFDDFAAWAKEHPEHDVGLHLALTSEWKHYRWPPVAPKKDVPGLVDPKGYMWKTVLEVAMKASPAEVEKEVRAQVERALSRGFRPTHLDTHMGTLYARPEFLRAFLKVAVEYQMPALVIDMDAKKAERFKKQGYPIDAIAPIVAKYPLPKIDDFHALPTGKTYQEAVEKFFGLARSLEPGITEIVFHPSDESETLRNILGRWKDRVHEARMFSDPKVLEFLRKEGFVLTSWKEMMRRFRERKDAKQVAAPARKGWY